MVYYSVAVGRDRGVFLTWPLCNKAVKDYPGALYRKWEKLEQATRYLNSYGVDEIGVYSPEGTLSLEEYCEQQTIPVPGTIEYIHQTLFDLKWGLYAEVCTHDGMTGLKLHQRDTETGECTDDGITLTFAQWKECINTGLTEILLHKLSNIKCGVKETYSHCLGSDVYASVSHPYPVFNIRRWYKSKEGELKPTREGITLREFEWLRLMNIQHLIKHSITAERDRTVSLPGTPPFPIY